MSCLRNSFLNNALGLRDTEMYLTFYQTEKKKPLLITIPLGLLA